MKIPAKYRGLLYLILMLILLPIVVYWLALRKTIISLNRLNNIENRIDTLQIAPVGDDYTTFRPANENRDIISDGAIINIASPVTEKYGVKVDKFTIYRIQTTEKIKVIAAEMELSGDYISIVQTIDFIEKEIVDCKITSLEFQTKKRDNQKTTYLSATLLIEQIITN